MAARIFNRESELNDYSVMTQGNAKTLIALSQIYQFAFISLISVIIINGKRLKEMYYQNKRPIKPSGFIY